jgi:hypothetical protein
MDARPTYARRKRSRNRALAWLATSALVALALIPGSSVQAVVAGPAARTAAPAAIQHADAEPSPTPTPPPESSPTPAPEPSPSATATPTPSPSPTPRPAEALIVAHKIIDADGDLDTENDQSPGEAWEFGIELSDATTEGDPFQLTGPSGGAGWGVSFEPDSASATLTEISQQGFELIDIDCLELGDEGDSSPGVRDGNSVTFELDLPGATITCAFFNTPEATPAGFTAWIYVSKRIDRDGDPNTDGDREWPPVWEFEVTFEDDAGVGSGTFETYYEEGGDWGFDVSGESAHVVLSEVQQEGYRLLRARCFMTDYNVEEEVPSILEGNSLSFDVAIDDLSNDYGCGFLNTPTSAAGLETTAPTVTLPPTSAITATTDEDPVGWQVVFAALLGLLGGVLILKKRGPASR